MAVRLSGAALAFVVAILLARAMGPDGYGTYAFAIAVATLLTVLAQLGLPTLIVREVARYKAAASWDGVRGLLHRAAQLIGLAGVLSVGIIAALIALLPSGPDSAARAPTLIWAAVLVPLMVCNLCGGAVLRGLGHVVRGQLAEQLVRPGALLLLAGAVAWFSGSARLTPALGMGLHAGAAGLAFLVGAVLLVRSAPPALRKAAASFRDQSRWFASLAPLTLLAGMQIVTSQTDVLMLGFLAEAAEVGIYRVGWQVANLVNLLTFAIGLSVEPSIARLHARNERERLQRMVTRTGRVAFALALCASLVLIGFGRPMLGLVFGPAFTEAYMVLAILCLGQVALAFSGWAVLALNMTGNERTTARYTAYAALANVVANAVLIPAFGLAGAAVATASTMCLWKLALARMARRVAGIRTTVLPLSAVERSGAGP